MGRSEFDEILEECLSALLEGRRGVDECLSLYPAWRGRLEPLLRAAEEIAAGLDQSPPEYMKERGLQRFLESARTRRRLRALLPPQAPGTPWWRWATTGLAAVIVVGTLAFTSAILMAEDGQRLSDRVTVKVSSPAPAPTVAPAQPQSALERVQAQVAALETSVRRGQVVEVELLMDLEQASTDLAAEMDAPEEVALIERVAAVSAASMGYDLLQELQAQSSGLQEQAIEASLVAAGDVLEKLGATPVPEPEPQVSPSPEPTPSPEASSTPGVEETPAGSPTPTPAP